MEEKSGRVNAPKISGVKHLNVPNKKKTKFVPPTSFLAKTT